MEEDNIISDDMEVANIMNNYFSNIVPLLGIQGYKCNYTYDTSIDEISNAINKFKAHPGIRKIKENNNIKENFFFQSQAYLKPLKN